MIDDSADASDAAVDAAEAAHEATAAADRAVAAAEQEQEAVDAVEEAIADAVEQDTARWTQEQITAITTQVALTNQNVSTLAEQLHQLAQETQAGFQSLTQQQVDTAALAEVALAVAAEPPSEPTPDLSPEAEPEPTQAVTTDESAEPEQPQKLKSRHRPRI